MIILNEFSINISKIYKLAKFIFKLYNKKYKSKWNFTLFFKEKLEKEIYTQDTTKSKIISLDLDNGNSIYNSFNEIILTFSKRSFIDLEGNINYRNYRNIKYDFDLIEEEIRKTILKKKNYLKMKVKDL